MKLKQKYFYFEPETEADAHGDSASEEPTAEQLEEETDELDTALDELAAELETLRADNDELRARISLLESDGSGSGNKNEPDESGGTGEPVVQPESGSGSSPGEPGEPVIVSATIIEEPPRSSHWIYRKLWGRD